MVQAEKHMLQKGFSRTLDSTATAQAFYRAREGVVGGMAEAVGIVERQWVRFEAPEEGERRARLSITASTVELEKELERWATRELSGIPWPTG
jgi:hypothetical protein